MVDKKYVSLENFELYEKLSKKMMSYELPNIPLFDIFFFGFGTVVAGVIYWPLGLATGVTGAYFIYRDIKNYKSIKYKISELEKRIYG